jgi:hypothetical protein
MRFENRADVSRTVKRGIEAGRSLRCGRPLSRAAAGRDDDAPPRLPYALELALEDPAFQRVTPEVARALQD